MNDAFSGSKCISEAIYSRNEVLKCSHWVMERRKDTRPFYRIIVFEYFQNCQCSPSIPENLFLVVHLLFLQYAFVGGPADFWHVLLIMTL